MRALIPFVLVLALALVGCETTGGVSAIEKGTITVTGSIVTTAFLDSLSDEELPDTQAAILDGCTLAESLLSGNVSGEMLSEIVTQIGQGIPEAYRLIFVSAVMSVLHDVDLPTASIGQANVDRLTALIAGVKSAATGYERRDLERFLRPPPPAKPNTKPPPPATLPKAKILPQ